MRSLKIRIVTPARPGTRRGNRVTALRWAAVLRRLGHTVTIANDYAGEACDLLLALHATKSSAAIQRFRAKRPGAPLIVALTGTDLYGDLPSNRATRRSLETATRIVALQPRALRALPAALRRKARVIHQSARGRTGARRRRATESHASPWFDVCVIGHLRPVKDPFRTAMASRLLPASSRVRVLHLGAPLTGEMARRARREASRNPRYVWMGERPRDETLGILARSRLLVLTSRMEGGANVVSEALVAGVPVISSRIEGSVGMLGEDYPGYFPAGDTAALARLLRRAESDPRFYARLERGCRRRARLFDPEREEQAWRSFLREMPRGSRLRRAARC